MNFTVRPLDPDDWRTLRDIRLRALKINPSVFSSNYERESAFTEDEWRSRLTDARSRIFGLFDGPQIIGVTGIVTIIENPAGAQMVMSFILPEYRGRSLSRLLYPPRIDWALSQPHLTSLNLSVREDNEASRRTCHHFGFELVGNGMKTWPDGTLALEMRYAIDLQKMRASKS